MIEKTRLEPPSNCDNCTSKRIKFTVNSVIFGENKGEWPYCYFCDNCGAMVGCHAGTNKPLGLMATGSTRRLRKKLHNLFDVIWQRDYLSRDDAYIWLGNSLGVIGTCHIGHLDKDQLKRAIELLKTHEANDYVQFKRRKEKRSARNKSSRERQANRIVRRKFGELKRDYYNPSGCRSSFEDNETD